MAPRGGGAGEKDTKVLSSFSSELNISKLLEDDSRILDTLEAHEEEMGQVDDFLAMDQVRCFRVLSLSLISSFHGNL